jgi:hypothetical protein
MGEYIFMQNKKFLKNIMKKSKNKIVKNKILYNKNATIKQSFYFVKFFSKIFFCNHSIVNYERMVIV